MAPVHCPNSPIRGGVTVTDRVTMIHDSIKRLSAENQRLREALQAAYELGHNDDCAYCAHKDQLICRTLIQEADRG